MIGIDLHSLATAMVFSLTSIALQCMLMQKFTCKQSEILFGNLFEVNP